VVSRSGYQRIGALRIRFGRIASGCANRACGLSRFADEDMVRLNRAVLVFLGMAAPPNNEELEPA